MSYHRTDGQENLNHIEKCNIGEFTQTVSLKKLLVNKYFLSHLFRIPEIYKALKEVSKV